MQNPPAPVTSVAMIFAQQVAALYPEPIRSSIEMASPSITLGAMRLSLEVVAAETTRLPYAKAVQSPEFPLMQQLFFGLQNVLQLELTKPMQDAMRMAVSRAAAGAFDPLRALLFSVAARQDHPESALCRFVLWAAVRLNLVVFTWEASEIEALGCLDELDLKAETVLRELLRVPDMFEPDLRPLDVLVKEMLLHLAPTVKRRWHEAVRDYGGEFDRVMTNADALEQVRALDAKDAVLYWPGPFEGPPGSTQIALRYPQHFKSANALEQHRSRRTKRKSTRPKARKGVALIDLMREPMEGVR